MTAERRATVLSMLFGSAQNTMEVPLVASSPALPTFRRLHGRAPSLIELVSARVMLRLRPRDPSKQAPLRQQDKKKHKKSSKHGDKEKKEKHHKDDKRSKKEAKRARSEVGTPSAAPEDGPVAERRHKDDYSPTEETRKEARPFDGAFAWRLAAWTLVACSRAWRFRSSFASDANRTCHSGSLGRAQMF